MRKLTLILTAMVLFTSICNSAFAQKEKEKTKEKTVKIKIKKKDSGKITKIDTVIVLKESEDLSKVLKKYNVDVKESEKGDFYTVDIEAADDDGVGTKMVVVSIDKDGTHKINSMTAHKMIFISDDDEEQEISIDTDDDFEHSYKFITDGDSTKKVIVMNGSKHWVSGNEGNYMVMSSGGHNAMRADMYEGAKPGDTVRVKTIISINGKETNVNEEEIIVGEQKNGKQYKKMMIIHEDGRKKTKTKKIIISTDDDMQWNGSDENVFVFKDDGKSSKIKVNINDATKGDLKKLKVPKSAKELKVSDLFIMFSSGDMMKLRFNIESKAKTTVRIYNESGKKLFEDVKSNFSGKYVKNISKMKGKMIIQISQDKNYFHKKLEIEY